MKVAARMKVAACWLGRSVAVNLDVDIRQRTPETRNTMSYAQDRIFIDADSHVIELMGISI